MKPDTSDDIHRLTKKMKQGFSFIELSIVLVIIGLLVAGVTGGARLMESSKLSKLIQEIHQINSSYEQFKMTYHAIPGDFNDAESFWGSSETTNGDGNRKILGTEMTHALKQLTLAELSDYEYDNSNYYILESFPQASLRFMHSEQGNFPYAQTSNLILIGKPDYAEQPYLRPASSYKIDTKIDDGLPKSGIMTYRTGGATAGVEATCTNTSTSYYSTYNEPGCNSAISLAK